MQESYLKEHMQILYIRLTVGKTKNEMGDVVLSPLLKLCQSSLIFTVILSCRTLKTHHSSNSNAKSCQNNLMANFSVRLKNCVRLRGIWDKIMRAKYHY